MFNDIIQSGDYKGEKHVPVIETEKQEDRVRVKVSVGREIPHPNTTEHHISWIEVYFLPEGEKFPCQIGRYEFSCHGASAQGPNTSMVYSEPIVETVFKADKGGEILALSYCNIHGLWQSSAEIR